MGLTFGSLFAGIGGFDLGFERCGMQCKWQVEIDDYATRILERHWPDVHRQRDIRQCGRHNLERVDCIIGGFPCQDISYAGKGAGLDGERSGLFFEAVCLVRELRPRAVVLENVAGLLTRGLDRVLGTLAEIGFDAEWHCIPAAAVGAPHIRDRVFVLAWTKQYGHVADASGRRRQKDELCARRNAARCSGKDVANAEVISSGSRLRQDARTGQPQAGSRTKPSNDGGDVSNAEEPGLEGPKSAGDSWTDGLVGESGPRGRQADWWAVEPNVGRVAHGVPARVDRLRCLGNAIVPQVAEVVGRILLDRLGGQADGR
jgi:DNA (cytosine-5)-methyltransferase 1